MNTFNFNYRYITKWKCFNYFVFDETAHDTNRFIVCRHLVLDSFDGHDLKDYSLLNYYIVITTIIITIIYILFIHNKNRKM